MLVRVFEASSSGSKKLLCVQNDIGIQRVYREAVQVWSKMLAIKMFM